MDGDGPVNVQELVDRAPGPVVVLDDERHVVASNIGLEPGRRVGDLDDVLVLYLGALPELSAYQELRAGFTAAVSHELRTPLARLLVLLETALLPGEDQAARSERARVEVERIAELIDDVLFLSELESGRAVVALGSIRALPVIEQVVIEANERAARAGVTLRIDCTASFEVPLRARMLQVVIENLVENAIRYAGDGTLCTICCREEAGTRVLVVADDGAGAASDDLPRLFERFYRGDRGRSTTGTGLGLAIVKHVAAAAEGTVEARPVEPHGLEVRLSFPA